MFEGASHIPEPGRPDLVSGRARVAANLAVDLGGRTAAGGLRRRLALAAFGGGSMWASMVGVAAAHKVAAIGLGMAALVGAGTVAQAGGLDAILDATGIHASQQGQGHDGSGDDGDGGASVGVGATSVDDGDAGPAGDSEATVAVSDAPDDLPGNLVIQIHDHSFTLRAVLCGITGSDVALATAGDCGGGEVTASTGDGLVTVTLGDEARMSVPGTRSANGGKPEVTTGASALATLDGYAGRLVFVRGTCDEEGDGLEDCTVTSIHVLGRAGQGATDGAGPLSEGQGSGSRPEGDPPFGGPPEGASGTAKDDDDDGPGKPDSVTPGPQDD